MYFFFNLTRTNIAVLEPLLNSLTNFWNQCGDEVLYDYGPEYLDEFKVCTPIKSN